MIAPMPGLLEYLIAQFPHAKRQTLKRMVEAGRVTINGRPARKLKEALAAGDVVKVDRAHQPPPPEIHPLKIVHEDEDVLVVHKPAGLLTSTVPREQRPTAIAIIRAYLAGREPKARPGVIHRLDCDASGLLVFSKNNLAYESLKEQFFHHRVTRIYTAAVHGTPSQQAARIESNLVELPDGSVHTTRQLGKGQRAITEYKVIKRNKQFSLLRVTLHTGRKHQIRAHLSERGSPIVGDPMYAGTQQPAPPAPRRSPNSPGRPRASRLMLAATQLAFTHPRTGQPASFEIPAPPELLALMEPQ